MSARVNPEVFHAKVYDITRLIPYGRVTSYGHIARLAGHPAHSRLVGAALKFLQDDTVPWHRVIGASGAISDRGDAGEGAARQAQRLVEEGVTVQHGRGEGVTIDFGHPNPNAKYKISMTNYGWFPDSVHLEGYDPDPVQLNTINDRANNSDSDDSSELSDLSDE